MASKADSRAGIAADAARVYTSDAADRIASASREVVAALITRGADSSLTMTAQRLSVHGGVDTIGARRRIAEAVIEAGRHPF